LRGEPDPSFSQRRGRSGSERPRPNQRGGRPPRPDRRPGERQPPG
jgi:hypothetical protein